MSVSELGENKRWYSNSSNMPPTLNRQTDSRRER